MASYTKKFRELAVGEVMHARDGRLAVPVDVIDQLMDQLAASVPSVPGRHLCQVQINIDVIGYFVEETRSQASSQ